MPRIGYGFQSRAVRRGLGETRSVSFFWQLGKLMVLGIKYSFAVRLLSVAIALVVLAPAASAQRANQAAPAKASPQDGSAEGRIAKLEEQIVDLQVVIGTLQSLIKGQGAVTAHTPAADGSFGAPNGGAGGGYEPSGGGGSGMSSRIDVIETQIRALTGQMEQMSRQLTGLQSGAGAGQGSYPPVSDQPLGPGQQLQPPTGPYDDRRGEGGPTNSIAANSTFGTLTVTPGDGAGRTVVGGTPAAVQGATDSRLIYEKAYRHLLQRDYGAAETGFQAYLAAAPTGQLAANAQYWLGETHYARGQYRVAADIFLKGYRRYRTAGKAPDSLLKLGMSLNQLGEKDAACATLAELSQNHPRAPEDIRQQADGERRRIGC